ncbi:MAG: hypothetical protein JSC189_000137 [Candidatus Tokpelaia sp. JSC189]|nr:MAG: hypothetical protein JSC189_000137 [Candidatus Tokpelaia sp. JSC189]
MTFPLYLSENIDQSEISQFFLYRAEIQEKQQHLEKTVLLIKAKANKLGT